MLQISYTDFGITVAVLIFLALCVVVTIYVVKTLKNVNKTLDNINNIIDTNKANIDDTLKSVPQICDNVNDITESLKDKTDLIDNFFSGDKEAAASSDFDNFLTVATSAIEIISGLTDKFGGKKKKLFSKK